MARRAQARVDDQHTMSGYVNAQKTSQEVRGVGQVPVCARSSCIFGWDNLGTAQTVVCLVISR